MVTFSRKSVLIGIVFLYVPIREKSFTSFIRARIIFFDLELSVRMTLKAFKNLLLIFQ